MLSEQPKNSNQIIHCTTVTEFQDQIDEGHIAYIDFPSQGREVYGTTEHVEIIPVLERIVEEVGVDAIAVLYFDTHHDFYNFLVGLDPKSENWAPHASNDGILPVPTSPNDEIYPFILVTEQSQDLGILQYDTDGGTKNWDGESALNLPGINGAKGPVTLIPVSHKDIIVDRVKKLLALSGKRLVVSVDSDFGEVQKLAQDEPRTRYESLVSEPWIAEILSLAHYVVLTRSPHFNRREYYERQEQEILNFLQNQT